MDKDFSGTRSVHFAWKSSQVLTKIVASMYSHNGWWHEKLRSSFNIRFKLAKRKLNRNITFDNRNFCRWLGAKIKVSLKTGPTAMKYSLHICVSFTPNKTGINGLGWTKHRSLCLESVWMFPHSTVVSICTGYGSCANLGPGLTERHWGTICKCVSTGYRYDNSCYKIITHHLITLHAKFCLILRQRASGPFYLFFQFFFLLFILGLNQIIYCVTTRHWSIVAFHTFLWRRTNKFFIGFTSYLIYKILIYKKKTTKKQQHWNDKSFDI